MFRIKKLDIFIVKQYALLFVGTFFICQFVLMMQFLWRYVDDLIGKGLTLDVMAQFFWYMGLMLMPQAFPLAILLSSLITFGNLGESSELTAIKAAGISLMQTFRPLIVIAVLMTFVSFYFQNVVGPQANQSFYQLLLSMKQKSPELEIPEGRFYDGIPGSNIYVQKKDMKTGMLYGIMIYRMTGSYEDAAIILADSGMMQSTAEKKHLLLSLYSGEWFENMRSQDLANSAAIPYRRETFSTKKILLDFDGEFNLADVADIAGDARAKSLGKILHDLDSIKEFNDSVGHAFYAEAMRYNYRRPHLGKEDSLKSVREAASEKTNYDSIFSKLKGDGKQTAVRNAMNSMQMSMTDLEFKSEYAKALHKRTRTHQIEAIKKFTLSLTCIIFFFIGAPLGAIIRKGGLGVPVIVDNTGYRMAREDEWTVGFGMSISTAVLAPVAAFFTYKANNDSVVFNIDLYKNLAMKILGIRTKRHVYRKEVIIDDPKYLEDARMLENINSEIYQYSKEHKLLHWPNPVKVFFKEGNDQRIEEINEQLEATIDDLGYTTDKVILSELNEYPVISPNAHTRPFRRKWLNILTGLVLPVGIIMYIRMIRFRLRLYKDLRTVRHTSNRIISYIYNNKV